MPWRGTSPRFPTFQTGRFHHCGVFVDVSGLGKVYVRLKSVLTTKDAVVKYSRMDRYDDVYSVETRSPHAKSIVGKISQAGSTRSHARCLYAHERSTSFLNVQTGELVESATRCPHRFLNRRRACKKQAVNSSE